MPMHRCVAGLPRRPICAAGVPPTLPSTIGREREVNPFFRLNDADVISRATEFFGATCRDLVAIYAALRALRDSFKPRESMRS